MPMPSTTLELALALCRLGLEDTYDLTVVTAPANGKQVVAVRCRATGEVVMYAAVMLADDAVGSRLH